MNAILITIWSKIRNSYWFVPSLMAISAILLSLVTTTLDSRLGSEWVEGINWLYANKPAGARAVLSTVAGSMITVAGVTFSMTILAISHTTSQVGPRLLNNFMGDRGNQITLGVFIATFIYCLMVLRTVRNADTAPPGGAPVGDLAAAFVPHIAVIVGVSLAIASVGVLIYFIHHIPEAIHVSNIIAGVGCGLNARIVDQFPARLGHPHKDKSDRSSISDLPDSFYESAVSITARRDGYIEYMDGDALMNAARKHDLILRVCSNPGDYVTTSSVLLLASPADRVDEEVERSLSRMFVCGAQRTATQDLRFQLNQLVEVAMRALSPGVNDPFTAISCMDWLQSALQQLSTRELPDAHRYDENQNLRIVAEPVTFTSFASMVCDQLRPYVSADRNAAIRMMELLGSVILQAPEHTSRRLLARHACALRRDCRKSLDSRALKELNQRYRALLRLLSDDEYRQRALNTGQWILSNDNGKS